MYHIRKIEAGYISLEITAKVNMIHNCSKKRLAGKTQEKHQASYFHSCSLRTENIER